MMEKLNKFLDISLIIISLIFAFLIIVDLIVKDMKGAAWLTVQLLFILIILFVTREKKENGSS